MSHITLSGAWKFFFQNSPRIPPPEKHQTHRGVNPSFCRWVCSTGDGFTSNLQDFLLRVAIILFVMSPQPQNLHHLLSLEHLIHQSVLNIDSSGIGTSKIADELLVRGRILEWIIDQNIQKQLRLRFQTSTCKLLRVLLRLFREDEEVFHQSSFLAHASTGVASPERMDSRIPGIETKYRLS